MKTIVYIGDFKESYSTERYIAHGFRELGFSVVCIQEHVLRIPKVEPVLDEIMQLDPAFVLFSKGRPIGESELLVEALKKRGVPTVCWLFDLYFGLTPERERRITSKIVPYSCEYIVSTDGGHQVEFEKHGIKHHVIRQGIHKPEAVMFNEDMTHPVIFVGGNSFGTRGPLFQALKLWYGHRFTRYGEGHNYIRGIELNKLYASTKIVVGDSQPSPGYWSNRIYETLGRGGFLIHPYVEGLENEFELGTHLVTYPYGDLDKLKELINYYLINGKEREKIRLAGFKYVRKHYTYQKRCEELLKLLNVQP